MSIIYDALKKVEKISVGDTKIQPEPKSKFKIYLIYGLITCAGGLIASLIFNLFTHWLWYNIKISKNAVLEKPPLINTDVITKNLPVIKSLPKISPAENQIEPLSEQNLKPPQSSFVLSGVFFSEDEGYALINNEIVREGDLIEGATVRSIKLDEVELEVKGSNIKLSPK